MVDDDHDNLKSEGEIQQKLREEVQEFGWLEEDRDDLESITENEASFDNELEGS